MSGVKHLADDLNVQRGRVSSREVLLFRGAERNPFFAGSFFSGVSSDVTIARVNAPADAKNNVFEISKVDLYSHATQSRTFTRLVEDIEYQKISMTNAALQRH
jgi:hypothetical protein